MDLGTFKIQTSWILSILVKIFLNYPFPDKWWIEEDVGYRDSTIETSHTWLLNRWVNSCHIWGWSLGWQAGDADGRLARCQAATAWPAGLVDQAGLVPNLFALPRINVSWGKKDRYIVIEEHIKVAVNVAWLIIWKKWINYCDTNKWKNNKYRKWRGNTMLFSCEYNWLSYIHSGDGLQWIGQK